jgi:hypothetical protein
MRLLPKLLIFSLAILFSIHGNTQQLTIAKDFNACLYGLIDQNGKWIVPAKYNLIRPFESGFAIVMKDNKYGLINQKGKEVIALEYDDMRRFPDCSMTYSPSGNKLLPNQYCYSKENLFQVTRGQLTGIIDAAGYAKIPVNYRSLHNFFNGVGIFISADGKKTGFIDLNGERGTLPDAYRNIVEYGEYRGLGVYAAGKPVMEGKKRIKTLYGVFNDSARLIIPFEYDSINACAGYMNLIEVYKNGKTGYFTKSGKKIYDAIYTINSAYHNVPLLVLNYFVPAFDGKYWGALGMNGNFVLDFKYDAVNSIPDYASFDSLRPAWLVKQNSSWGILSKKGEWIISPSYNMILPDYWPFPGKKNEYIFQVKSQSGWGSVSSAGDELMPMIYDTLFSNGHSYLFWSERSADVLFFQTEENMVALYKFDPEKEEMENEKQHKEWIKEHKNDSVTPDPFLRYVEDDIPSSSEPFMLGENKNNPYQYAQRLPYIPFISSEHVLTPATGDKDYFFCTATDARVNFKSQYSHYYVDGNYGSVTVYPELLHKTKTGYELCRLNNFASDTQYNYYFINEDQGIVRSDGKLLVKPGTFRKVNYPISANPMKCIVEGKDYRSMGVITIDGKLVTDTIWTSINSWKGDTVSVRSYSGSGACHGEWNLLDLSSGKLLLPEDRQFIEPLKQTKGTDVAGTSTGVGLYSIDQMKFVLPPVYMRIAELNYNSGKFIVEKCDGQFGIVNRGGVWETDSCWTSIICVDHSQSRNYNQVYDGRDKYLLLNDKTWVLYDNVNGQQKATPVLTNQVFNFASKQYLHKTNNYGHDDNYCAECPLLDKAWLPVLKPWEADLLFNQLYRAPQTIDHREKLHYSEYGCSCSAKNVKDAVRNKQGYAHVENQLHYATDSCFSFVQGTTSDSYFQDKLWESYNPWNHYFYNYFLFADGPRDLTLDSMFTGEAWKITIANEAMNYLRTHPGIEASCTDPTKYPVMLNHSFLVEAQALRFFPNWSYKEKGVEFTVPWTTLKPYLRPEIAHKLGFN